jgi:DNA-binding CsgD family transcriptional regulator
MDSQRGADVDDVPPRLTHREWEIVHLVAEGLTEAEIGDVLCISRRTVHNHLTHVYSKAGVRNRAQLVAWYLRLREAASGIDLNSSYT